MLVCLGPAYFSLGGTACRLESEESLRSKFEKNFETLCEIHEMLKKDAHLVRVAPDFTRLVDDWSWPRPKEKVGLSEVRWNTYRSLFEKAGIRDGIQRDGPYVWFFVSAVGLSVTGASRGYVYTEEKPSRSIARLDDFHEDDVAFIPLRCNWYLFQWNVQ